MFSCARTPIKRAHCRPRACRLYPFTHPPTPKKLRYDISAPPLMCFSDLLMPGRYLPGYFLPPGIPSPTLGELTIFCTRMAAAAAAASLYQHQCMTLRFTASGLIPSEFLPTCTRSHGATISLHQPMPNEIRLPWARACADKLLQKTAAPGPRY